MGRRHTAPKTSQVDQKSPAMQRTLRSHLALLIIAAWTGLAAADPPPLSEQIETAAQSDFFTIGDPAPALDAAHWLRGEEIGYLEPGRIYVIEFWSTWCKYCHAAMPCLTEVQERYAEDGVTVIGISDEKLQTVFEFLARPEWNQQARYSIATDPDLSVQKNYMEAAAIGDIPTIFLIGREGVIEWIGHPRHLDEPLEAVIEGSWDREEFKIQFEKEIVPARERYQRMREMKAAYELKQWDLLLLLFDAAIESDRKPDPLRIQRFLLMIGEMNRPEEGYAYGRELLRDFWDNAGMLNQLAWAVVDHETVVRRDLEFAMKAAERAGTLSDHTDAHILDTLARVHYELGDLPAALSWQRKAVDHVQPDDPLAEIIRAALRQYEEEEKRRPPQPVE